MTDENEEIFENSDEELSKIAEKVWPDAFVEFDKVFDAPGTLVVLQTQKEGFWEGCNLIKLEIVEHPRMRAAMRAALCALASITHGEIFMPEHPTHD